MSKWILASCLAVGLAFSGWGASTATADDGYHGHHDHYHYRPSCYNRTPVYRSGYGVPYTPYYSTRYMAPGLSVSRSSYYPGTILPMVRPASSLYGWGGYGNLGYPSTRYYSTPGVQLRIGF